MESSNIEIPKIKSEVYTEKVLASIADAYGLPTLSFISSPAEGIITENALLRDEDGCIYFAKLYNGEAAAKHASVYRASELIAQNPLVPVVLPLLPKDGSYTVSINDSSFALFPYIEHDSDMPDNLDDMCSLQFKTAEVLGRIHATVVPENEPLLRPMERWQEGAGLRRVKILERILVQIEEKTTLDDFDVLALSVTRQKLDFLKQTGEAHGVSIPDAICHADFHGKNILHDHDMNIVAVCDWDNAGLANPYVDFHNAFNSNVIRSKFNSDTEQLALAKAFIAGYESGTGKAIDTQALKDSFEVFFQERIGSTWPLYQHYIDNNTKNDPILKRVARDIQEMPNKREAFLDLLKSAIAGNKGL